MSLPACWRNGVAAGQQRQALHAGLAKRQNLCPRARKNLTSASLSSLRYEMARSAPSLANMSAAARPMPESPPVISAICAAQDTTCISAHVARRHEQ